MTWLGRELGYEDRRDFDAVLRNDALPEDKKRRAAELIGAPYAELFPEPEPSPEAA